MLRDQEHIDRRYSLQAEWSKPLREYIYRKYLGDGPLSVLEVGSGTGSVIRKISGEKPDRIKSVVGIDKDPHAVKYASYVSAGPFCIGKGEALPFESSRFDFVFCHYLLLWVRDPVKILKEMNRVTVSGGICAAMAEPCYEELSASPGSVRRLAERQRKSLIARGMDPKTGRKLSEYFLDAGFRSIESGQYIKCEMTVDYLQNEIRQMAEDAGIDDAVPAPIRGLEYHIPTYYALAQK